MHVILNTILIAWIALNIMSAVSAWRYSWGLPRPERPGRTPRVAIIVAIKNASDLTASFLARLRSQAYPDYHILAAVESEADPAFALIAQAAREPGPNIDVVIAGLVERGGQKVWNLVAALKEIQSNDEIIVFTDADVLPTPEWLGRLVSALTDAGLEAVTGYRWMIPSDGRVSSAALAAANASIITMPRVAAAANMCWGGTMALRRDTLEKIGVERFWRGAISDDLQMTRALGAADCAISSPRQSLLLSPIAMDWRQAFAFGQRQYRLVLLHEPLLWLFAAGVTVLPFIGACLSPLFLWQDHSLAIIALASSLACGEIRFRCRRQIFHSLWPDMKDRDLSVYWRVERWLRPVWWTFHMVCIFAALGSRRIRWAGIEYEIRGRQQVEIISRSYGAEQPCFAAGLKSLAPDHS